MRRAIAVLLQVLVTVVGLLAYSSRRAIWNGLRLTSATIPLPTTSITPLPQPATVASDASALTQPSAAKLTSVPTALPTNSTTPSPTPTQPPAPVPLPSGNVPVKFPCKVEKNARNKFSGATWFADYEAKVSSVQYDPKSRNTLAVVPGVCKRWWHPTPQPSYHELPYRASRWQSSRKIKHGVQYPRCDFDAKSDTNPTGCGLTLQKLFSKLDELGVIYFARSGTELAISRSGAGDTTSALKADGDIDIYVDMPQNTLKDTLNRNLSPKTTAKGSSGISQESHWRTPKCPTVHMVFNDWMADELGRRPAHADLCTCHISGAALKCHKETPYRMYIQYGPSWQLPLYLKQMDMPAWVLKNPRHAWSKIISKKLNGMVLQKTGLIEKESVDKLTPGGITFTQKEMNLILAQLNIIRLYANH